MNQETGAVPSTTAVPPPPPPHYGSFPSVASQPPATNRRMWLWIGLGVFLMGAGIAWFAHMMVGGYRQTSALIATLHNQMSRQDWDAIYNEAASGYREELTADQNRQIFEGIERKLGSPVSTKQKSFFINTNNGVTVVTASFETTFSGNATATETIVWRSYGGSFRLYSYNINSIDLITR